MKYQLELSPDTHCQYSLVQSARAKYIRIKISPVGVVDVVVPKQANDQQAHDFVSQRKNWIIKCLQKIKESPLSAPPKVVIPDQLYLPLTDEIWKLDYKATGYNGIQLTPNIVDTPKDLLLEGEVKDKELVFNVLEKWLKIRAKSFLPDMLENLSVQCGLPYNRLTIRGQKTRWGSCSSKQNINLNYKLLFFPEEVVRYVCIHELCHTKEMNHSKRFWDLVKQYDPDYQQHRLALKDSNHCVPGGL
ncbi:MAG: SprT family zinc-dependent metalloprotease [Thiotrichaceae bacterium]